MRETACLVTDVRLPGISGLELQTRLISDGHLIPIIFFTSYPEDAIRVLALRNGAVGYLSKPLQEQSLIACLDQKLSSAPGRLDQALERPGNIRPEKTSAPRVHRFAIYPSV